MTKSISVTASIFLPYLKINKSARLSIVIDNVNPIEIMIKYAQHNHQYIILLFLKKHSKTRQQQEFSNAKKVVEYIDQLSRQFDLSSATLLFATDSKSGVLRLL